MRAPRLPFSAGTFVASLPSTHAVMCTRPPRPHPRLCDNVSDELLETLIGPEAVVHSQPCRHPHTPRIRSWRTIRARHLSLDVWSDYCAALKARMFESEYGRRNCGRCHRRDPATCAARKEAGARRPGARLHGAGHQRTRSPAWKLMRCHYEIKRKSTRRCSTQAWSSCRALDIRPPSSQMPIKTATCRGRASLLVSFAFAFVGALGKLIRDRLQRRWQKKMDFALLRDWHVPAVVH
jgi:hypothetical protein